MEEAAATLASEGLSAVRTEFVGNIMIDALLATLPRARDSRFRRGLDSRQEATFW